MAASTMPSLTGSRPVKCLPEECSSRSRENSLQGKPSTHPRLQLLSPVELERHAAYDGPTWLDQAIVAKWRPDGVPWVQHLE